MAPRVATSQDGGQDTKASNVNWSQISAYLSQVATEHAFDLPPLQEDLSFLRLCHVLAYLCHAVYAHKQADVGSKSTIEVPLAGALHDVTAVTATLLHFREADIGQELSLPQQYGVWRVSGLGLVVAFRGTASSEDVFIDANVSPVPLASDGAADGIHVHRGFAEGARQHLDAIVATIQSANTAAEKPLPVWISGHSLGGAYANCLMLQLLERKSTARLFTAGGGSVTFGAPMVIQADEPKLLYEQLEALDGFAQAQLPPGCRIQYHNFVNNADIVPRLLGTSLDSVHGAVEAYIPSMKRVRRIAQSYQPFGTYHLIVGASVRTLDTHPSARDTAAMEGCGRSRLGDAALAAEVTNQLGMNRIWKAVYGTSGKGAGVTHHSIMSYQERLLTYMTELARARSPRQLLNPGPLDREVASQNMTSLFTPSLRPESDEKGKSGALDARALDAVGKALGAAAQTTAAQLGSSAMQALRERWTAPPEAQKPKADPTASSSAASSTSYWWWAQRNPSKSATPNTDASSTTGSAETRQPKKGLRAAGSRWEITETAETGNNLAPSNFKELSAAVGGALSEYMQSLSTTQKASNEKRNSGKQDL